jgi:hypothetical protein
MKALFGGSTTKSGPVDVTPSDIEGLRKSAGSVLEAFLKKGGGPEYKGPLVAELGDNERSILNLLMDDANGASGRQDLIRQTMEGRFLPGQPGANPYLESAIAAAQRPTFEGLGETLGRQLPGQFLQAGHTFNPATFANNVIAQAGGGNTIAGGSSAFDRASAIATRGATQAAADIGTKMSSDAYESERTRQNEAIKFSQAETELMVSNLQAQALPRMIEDLGIERGIELFKSRTQEMLAALSSLGQFGQLTNIGQKSKTDQQNGIIPSLFPKGLGGGSMSA